ncbi:MAG: 2-hydroxychromene-2-carboxylate isomerase [Rhodospirillales bacterium]
MPVPTAPDPIEFWFDFASPYAWFASREIEALAARHGRAVLWRPFLLGAVFKVTGMVPLAPSTLRGDYARRDWERLARQLGIGFAPPASHPGATVTAARAFYWLEARDAAAAAGFARALLDAYFGNGVDIATADGVAAVAAQCRLDPAAVLAGAAEPAVKDRLRAVTDQAIARGIFGAPFVLVDGEPFWGHDRLPMVDDWLARGGW